MGFEFLKLMKLFENLLFRTNFLFKNVRKLMQLYKENALNRLFLAKKNKFPHPNIAAKLLTDALCTPKVGLMATGESFCNKV